MKRFPAKDAESLEERLRSGARTFAPAPPPELRGRILAALHAAPRPVVPVVDPRATRRGSALAAAAAALVLTSAWWLTRPAAGRTPRAASVVELSRGLLEAGTRVLELPGEAGDNLRLEAARMLADTTRVAEGVVRGLPGPLRAKLERM